MEGYLQNLEKQRNIILPECYKLFYLECARKMPRSLTGTDLFNSYPDLNESAVALLQENEMENFLTKDDFVFMMHQGYIFWYFKANGDPDPMVYMFHEVEKYGHAAVGFFSEFIREYLQ